MKVSILMPVFNERYLVRECVRRVLAASLPKRVTRELILVDDGSTDGSSQILSAIQHKHPDRVKLLRHERNMGKGAAIRTAIGAADGDILLIQDSDLEYDPRDYADLLQPILDGDADAVYGSRFHSRGKRRILLFWHTVGNKLLTVISNSLTNLNLTDMETGYKAVLAPFLKHLPIRCNRFGIEPELTAKLAKQKCRIYEVPINYAGRTYDEGKKIRFWDGVKALGAILKFWLIDDLYSEDQVGELILNQLNGTPHFNRWMADTIRKYVGHRALETGAGIGNLGALLCHRELYVMSDIDEHYCSYLTRRFANRPNIRVAKLDISRAEDFRRLNARVDTVICLNVLEHIDDDKTALQNIKRVLIEDGNLILLVPQIPLLYGSLDQALGHQRRYSRGKLLRLLKNVGFQIEEVMNFNRFSMPAWFVNGKILRRRHFGKIQLKIFDLFMWLIKRVDSFMPWPGQSLIVVARKQDSS